MQITLDPGGPHSPAYTAEVASAIPEAVRVLNHATLNHPGDALAFPADADTVIRAVATAAQRLPQLFGQLCSWLAEEDLSGRTAATYGEFSGEPAAAAATVRARLDDASAAAHTLQSALTAAAAVTATISASGQGEQETSDG